jgi:hypothetical protein
MHLGAGQFTWPALFVEIAQCLVEFEMKLFVAGCLVFAIVAVSALGCGGSAEKGVNSGKDMPKPAEKR